MNDTIELIGCNLAKCLYPVFRPQGWNVCDV